MTKLVLLDYNGTIVPNDPDTRPYYSIIKSIFNKEIADKFKSPNSSKELLKEKNFSKGDFTTYFGEFKKTPLYNIFKATENPEILSVLSKCDKLPDSDIENFVFEDIIYPLMALYNVHIAKVKPFATVSDFFAKNAGSDVCIVINSDSPKRTLITELQEYAKMEEYKFLRLLTEKHIFGNEDKTKKSDDDRVQFIIDSLRNERILTGPLEQIKIIGDTKSDVNSFESVKPDMRQRTTLTLTMENYSMLIFKLRKMSDELASDKTNLESVIKRLEKTECEKEELERKAGQNPAIRIVETIGNIRL